ncbi:MAG: LytR/AlgR family response regulator transcription factor [Coprobacillaceae bacterium]
MIRIHIMISNQDTGYMIRSTLSKHHIEYQYTPFEHQNKYDIIFIEIHSIDDISNFQELRKDNEDAYLVIFGPPDISIMQASFILQPIGYVKNNFIENDFKNVCNDLIPILEKEFNRYQIQTRYGTSNIRIDSINYIKSVKHYLKINTSSATYSERNTIQGFLEKVNSNQFVLVHRSYIVNVDKIKEVKNDSIILHDDSSIPMSRTYKKDIWDLIHNKG